jgi:hypothetical protein
VARRLELRAVELADVGGNPQILDYGVMMMLILRQAPRGGLTLDDMVKSVDALKPIRAAAEAGADHVVLPDEHWRTLVDKLAAFPFAVADPVLVEFGLMIRDAPEIGAGAGNGLAEAAVQQSLAPPGGTTGAIAAGGRA